MADEPEQEADGESADPVGRMQALLDEFKETTGKDKPAEFKGKNLKEAEDEAYVRVRAHIRQRRQQKETPAPGA